MIWSSKLLTFLFLWSNIPASLTCKGEYISLESSVVPRPLAYFSCPLKCKFLDQPMLTHFRDWIKLQRSAAGRRNYLIPTWCHISELMFSIMMSIIEGFCLIRMQLNQGLKVSTRNLPTISPVGWLFSVEYLHTEQLSFRRVHVANSLVL